MQSIARVCVLGAAKPQQRRVKLQLSQRRRMATGAPDPATIKPNMNVMKIGVQTIFAGTEALEPFVAELKTYSRRPLIVTDEGIAKVGLVQQFVDALKKAGLQPTVFDKCVPNPTTGNTIGIAQSFFQGTCDAVVGLGGGGPLDAAKAGMALVAQKRVDPKFDLERDGHKFISNIRPFMSTTPKENPKGWEQFVSSVPSIAGIPTTAGTGSEGGKSAVITLPDGVKMVFGNPVFMPKTVALVPQFTQKLPASLTAGTGIDALFHNMEAFFVTYQAALNDGMNDAEIAYTDDFALKGISLIVDNLPNAIKNGNDLNTRLKMQVAALYGAKAFRKGDLGGVHATAHALGAFYHLHHGTAIARMSVPVLKYNAERMSDETRKAFGAVHEIFKKGGYAGATLADSTAKFLSPLGIPLGLKELPVQTGDIEKLAKIAANDPCQTNPVPLKEQDYLAIFQSAKKM